MAVLRTDPNISIQQTTPGIVVSPTTNDPNPTVRIVTEVENTPITYPTPGKVTVLCTGSNPATCTPG